MEWLLAADITRFCKAVTDVKFELCDYVREGFYRAYTTDLSLLLAMRGFDLKQHIVENTLEANTKGGLYECLIADILIKKNLPIYFYKNETAKKEIDFLIAKDGEVLPIEVKSGRNRAGSLNWLMKTKQLPMAYKFCDGNVYVGEDGIITMPLYCELPEKITTH